MKKLLLSTLLILLLISSVMLSACSIDPVSVNPEPKSTTGTYVETNLDITGEVELQQFKSEEEYKQFLETYGGNSYGYYGGSTRLMAAVESMDIMESAAAPTMNTKAVSFDDGGSLDYSETNNQVQGVDEADILKTDGEYIYTLSGNTLHIVQAYPGEEAELLYSEVFENTNPESLFVEGNTLAIFSRTYDNDVFERIGFRPNSGLTTVTLYDITNKEAPEQLKEYQLEGNYYDARLIGETMYVVLREYSPYARIDYPTPIIMEGGEVRAIPVTDMYYYSMPYSSTELVMIHAIATNGEDMDSVAITTDNIQSIYMSMNNLYVVSSEYISEYDIEKEIMKELITPKLTAMDKNLIEKIKQTDNDVLNQHEKEQKIQNVYYNYAQGLTSEEQDALTEESDALLAKKLDEIEHFQYSVINKIRIDGNKVAVGEMGKVPGRITNQFSLDEHNNVLRIATTIDGRWDRKSATSTQSTNNVWTLDSNLELSGELTGLAEGERIYSTRFMGERLYMVTFRQVDPFFVIDLSNPQEPKELGELKIPGFSNYLHPYDDNHIIGIGKEATDMGRVTGLKISLFDVEDVNNPTEVAKFVTDEKYSQSTALYEHKAFLFNKEKELMVIPAYHYDYKGEEEGYDGAMVFRITDNEITLRGLIDHSKYSGSRYGGSVERSLYIADALYTKSRNVLRINNLETLEGIKDVSLEVTSSSMQKY